MPAKPIIGIPCYQDILPPTQRPRYWMYQTYVKALEAADAIPVLIPLLNSEAISALFDRLDGILLAGGDDVNPNRYDQDHHPKTEPPDDQRDQVEINLAKQAVESHKPLLAICRGMQVLNVAFGGTLIQHIPEQVNGALQHEFNYDDYHNRHIVTHTVTIEADSRLASILGKGEIGVNSFHHQALDRLAESLVPVAYAPDGVLEAVEGRGADFVLAVQWHPEDMFHEGNRMLALFKAFVAYIQQNQKPV